MPRYVVTLTDEEIQELKAIIQKDGRWPQEEKRSRKVTGDVEARICAIACSKPPSGASRWTMQAIADELIRLEVVDYITDSTICDVMKKTKLSHGL